MKISAFEIEAIIDKNYNITYLDCNYVEVSPDKLNIGEEYYPSVVFRVFVSSKNRSYATEWGIIKFKGPGRYSAVLPLTERYKLQRNDIILCYASLRDKEAKTVVYKVVKKAYR